MDWCITCGEKYMDEEMEGYECKYCMADWWHSYFLLEI